MLKCWEQPEVDRTFYRRDLLRQHLTTVHATEGEHQLPTEIDVLGSLERPLPASNAASLLQLHSAGLIFLKAKCWRNHRLVESLLNGDLHYLELDFNQDWRKALRTSFGVSGKKPRSNDVVDELCCQISNYLKGAMLA